MPVNLVVRGPIALPAGGSATTWSLTDKSSDLTLDGTKLIYSGFGSGTYNNVRSMASHSTGKYYWQTVATTESLPNAVFQGFGNVSAALAGGSAALGSDNNAMGWSGAGTIQLNGGTYTTIQGWAQGDTLCFALDLTNSKVWFRTTTSGNWNNAAIGSQNPATNTGGIDIVAAAMAAGPYFAMGGTIVSGDVYTTDFTTMTFAPSGFGPF